MLRGMPSVRVSADPPAFASGFGIVPHSGCITGKPIRWWP